MVQSQEEASGRVSFDSVEVVVEVADSQETRIQGLSGRESLPAQEGMLFIFDREDFYEFHMLDMNFAIDIIWIDEDLAVVDITHNLLPESYPDRVAPKQPARYILEVNAGFASKHEIEVGDRASIDF